MRVARALGLCGGFLLLLALPAAARASEWRTDASGYDAAVDEQKHTGAPILVYFHTEWCGYCHALSDKVLSTPQVGEFLAPFAKVQINPEDSSDNEELGHRFGITGYPTVFLIVAGRPPVQLQVSGDRGPEQFISAVRHVTGTHLTGKAGAAPVIEPVAKVVLPAAISRDVPPEILALHDQGRTDEAIAALTRTIAQQEKGGADAKPALYYARGAMNRAMRKHAAAAADFQAYVDGHPGDADAEELLARSYLNIKLYDDAATTLLPLVNDKPTAERWFLLGTAEAGRSHDKQSRAAFATACKLGDKAACR